MDNTVFRRIIMILFLICAASLSACNLSNREGSNADEITVFPIETEPPAEMEGIEISNEILEIILLARTYYDKFSHQKNFVEIDNQLFHDYIGGTELTLDEFKEFLSKLGDNYSPEYYLERVNDEDFIMNTKTFDDPSYEIKADIDNDGIDEIFIGAFDTGSLNNAWTTVYKLYDGHYDVLFATSQQTVYRIVNYNGKNFLFLPIPKNYGTDEYGFDIIYFGNSGLESYCIFGNKIEKTDLFDSK